MKFSIIFTALCIGICANCIGSSTITVEEAALNHLVSALKNFASKYGQLPRTWKEIESGFDIDFENRSVTSAYGFRLEDRYFLVDVPYPIFRNGDDFDIDEDSRVFMVRIIPFKDYRDNGKIYRTFIYQDSNGQIAAKSILENEKAQILFRKYHVTPVVPIGLPTIETNVNRSRTEILGALVNSSEAKRVWPLPVGRHISSKPSPKESNPVQTMKNNSERSAHTSLAYFTVLLVCFAISVIFLFMRRWIKSRRIMFLHGRRK